MVTDGEIYEGRFIINLYDEIISQLQNYNKTINDIKFISMGVPTDNHCVKQVEIPITNFLEVAKKTDYDCDYGQVFIPISLQIVGEDWWLERREIDGQEWFVYKEFPTKPNEIVTIAKIEYEE